MPVEKQGPGNSSWVYRKPEPGEDDDYPVGDENGPAELRETFPAPVPAEDLEVAEPDHYTRGDVECIDAIKAALGPAGFEGWCVGGAIKYLWRYRHKGRPRQDLEKARRFIDIILDELDD